MIWVYGRYEVAEKLSALTALWRCSRFMTRKSYRSVARYVVVLVVVIHQASVHVPNKPKHT